MRKWPFSRDSIWNTPIGSQARYVPQPVDPNHIEGPHADLDIIILTPEAPDMEVFGTEYRWQAGTTQETRCKRYTDKPLATLPIASNYVTLFYKQSKPNNAALIMRRDGRSLMQTQPFQACKGGYATSGLRMPFDRNELLALDDIDIYGDGTYGMHGGSGLNTMGGAIRLGELTSPEIDSMRHTLKISFPGEQYLFFDQEKRVGYRWPARKHDTGAATDYKARIPDAKIGVLRALKPGLDIEALGLETLAARKLAWTLQNYGAYQVEGVPWPKMMIAVEESPEGSVVEEVKSAFGFEFASNDKAGNPWVRDLMRIVPHLQIVANNSEQTPGGGGTPLQPKAPDFCR